MTGTLEETVLPLGLLSRFSQGTPSWTPLCWQPHMALEHIVGRRSEGLSRSSEGMWRDGLQQTLLPQAQLTASIAGMDSVRTVLSDASTMGSPKTRLWLEYPTTDG